MAKGFLHLDSNVKTAFGTEPAVFHEPRPRDGVPVLYVGGSGASELNPILHDIIRRDPIDVKIILRKSTMGLCRTTGFECQ